MKLNKLHVLNTPLGSIHHCYTITSGNNRIGSTAIYLAGATCGQQRYLGEDSIYLIGLHIQGINSVAFYVWSRFGNQLAQMMLGDDIYYKVFFVKMNIGHR